MATKKEVYENWFHRPGESIEETAPTATDYVLIVDDGGNILRSSIANLLANPDGSLTIGEDDTGYDVTFFGDTSGKNWLWDASADKMIVTGDSQLSGAITADATTATALTFSGTNSTSAITCSGTHTKIISAGSYSSPLANTGSEMITVGGTASSGFVLGIGSYMKATGEDAKPIAADIYAISTDTTGTPTLQGMQCMAFLGTIGGTEAATLKTMDGDATAGMYAGWFKLGSNTNCTLASGSRTAAIWVDNQHGAGTNNGEEYSIFATTGGTQPDAFIGFETTSSGWDHLFYFDETAYDQDPVVSGDLTGNSKSYYLKVNLNGTTYGIQLFATS